MEQKVWKGGLGMRTGDPEKEWFPFKTAPCLFMRTKMLSRLRSSMLAAGLALSTVSLQAAPEGFDHSHSLFADVLQSFVKEGSVDYAALKKNPDSLNRYLEALDAISKETFEQWTRERRLAFLINLYNASALQLILNHYPVDSIKDIGWVFKGPFEQKIVPWFGTTITLDKLEHGVLREEYNEPRIHFALVCAAKGCPPLRSEPYAGDRLDQQLNEQARRFLSNSEKNRVEIEKRVVSLSPIFKWFKEDFVTEESGLLESISKWFPQEEQKALNRFEFRIRYTDYDWSLNKQ